MVKKSNNQIGTIIIVLLVVAGLIYLVMMMNNKNVKNTGNLNLDSSESNEMMVPSPDSNPMMMNVAPAGLDTPQMEQNQPSNEQPSNNDIAMNSNENPREGFNSSCYPKEQLTAQELLPKNEEAQE